MKKVEGMKYKIGITLSMLAFHKGRIERSEGGKITVEDARQNKWVKEGIAQEMEEEKVIRSLKWMTDWLFFPVCSFIEQSLSFDWSMERFWLMLGRTTDLKDPLYISFFSPFLPWPSIIVTLISHFGHLASVYCKTLVAVNKWLVIGMENAKIKMCPSKKWYWNYIKVIKLCESKE